jgi:uracil-DNA glycosylase
MLRQEVRDFGEWRAAARPLLATAVPPEDIVWSDWRSPSLGETEDVHVGPRPSSSHAALAPVAPGIPTSAGHGSRTPAVPGNRMASNFAPPPPAIPRRLLSLLEELACYRDPGRWELMYRLTWRVLHQNRALLDNDADPDVQRARAWARAIHRDVHKMHAFVRFQETRTDTGDKHYVAWFEPAHEILRTTAPFFEKRFANMRWMIATPDGAAVWSGERTDFIESPSRSKLPRHDSTHSLWRTYYRNICNVARINPLVMQREMPKRYWQHLPEASEIKGLLSEGRVTTQQALITPARPDELRIPQAIARSLERIVPPADSPLTCKLCNLWRHATQAVIGEGPPNAAVMLVGEQPGDEEDLKGRPFVGPAGQVLDEILQRAGLNRAELFVTNSVKHFKWEPRGKRRLHKRPGQEEVGACGTWLDREIANVAPRVIVALGATAIRAVTGSSEKIEDARQRVLRHSRGAWVICTYHPSAILRSDADRKLALSQALEDDLRRAAGLLTPA